MCIMYAIPARMRAWCPPKRQGSELHNIVVISEVSRGRSISGGRNGEGIKDNTFQPQEETRK